MMFAIKFSLSFGISYDHEETAKGCCPWNRNELYSFCIEEPYLFRFLFQSDYFSGKTLLELIDAEELTPVLSAMQKSLGIGMEQTKKVFLTVFLFAHGYASIIANNSMKYDEDIINSQLEQAYRGAILAAQEKAE